MKRKSVEFRGNRKLNKETFTFNTFLICFYCFITPLQRTCAISWAGAGAVSGDFQCCGCRGAAAVCSEKAADTGASSTTIGSTCTQQLLAKYCITRIRI